MSQHLAYSAYKNTIVTIICIPGKNADPGLS